MIGVLFPTGTKSRRTESTLDQTVDTPDAPVLTNEKAQSEKAQSPAHSDHQPSSRNVP